MANMWDERYRDPEYIYGTEPNGFLASVVDRLPNNGRVLCIGEGEGRNAVFLAERGFDVTAMDLSRVGLEKARALANDRGVEIHTVVAELSDFVIEPEAWDAIVAIWVHLAPDLRRTVHARMVAGLARGGAAVIEAYTPKQLEYGTGGPPRAELLYTGEMLRDDFAPLRIDICGEGEREVVEGSAHEGTGHTVRFLGLKPA